MDKLFNFLLLITEIVFLIDVLSSKFQFKRRNLTITNHD